MQVCRLDLQARVRKVAAVVALALTVSGCVNSAPNLRQIHQDDPLALTEMGERELCRGIRAAERRREWNAIDTDIAEPILRARGFSQRDRELILRHGVHYGTGMTMRGLSCSVAEPFEVNKSFYQFSGHHWQAVLGDFGPYIYLEGDGTSEGMIVTSWN